MKYKPGLITAFSCCGCIAFGGVALIFLGLVSALLTPNSPKVSHADAPRIVAKKKLSPVKKKPYPDPKQLAIYIDVATIEDAEYKKIDKKYLWHSGDSDAKTINFTARQSQDEQKMVDDIRRRMCKKYHLSESQFDNILTEANRRQWARRPLKMPRPKGASLVPNGFEDLSTSLTKRYKIRMTVAPGLTEEELQQVMLVTAKDTLDSEHADAVAVYAYIDWTDTSGQYTAGNCILAPFGDWSMSSSPHTPADMKAVFDVKPEYLKESL